MNTDKNYLQIYKAIIEELRREKKRPSLFLHACCGPCLTYPLSVLIKDFDVTIGFFNPNIQPVEEYDRRLEALKKFVQEYSSDIGVKIPLVINEEDFNAYKMAFADRIKDKEGGEACLRCHAHRMNLAYEYAYQHHFDYFTTVMTVSCKKPSRELNLIAEDLEKKYPTTKYLYSDFKKENGQLLGIRIARKYDVYRQNYCGCIPSLLERIEYMKKKEKESQSENSLTI